jgi:hypothetical protein
MTTTDTARTVREFMDDPVRYFDYSVTRAHSLPREELRALQLEAMDLRLQEHRESIEMVRRASNREGVTRIADVDDVVPLLFSHSIYKSYPSSFLDNRRYDLLTRWLDRLTSADLSAVDVSGCEDIDNWLDAIDAQTPLQPITSSGTTGTLSVIPTSLAQGEYTLTLWRMTFFQEFGKEPGPDELDPDVHVIWPNHSGGKLGHLRMAPLLANYFTGGDPSKFHALYNESVSTDLMYLAAKIMAAASKGELDRLEIPPRLLARKAEFEDLIARRPAEMLEFFRKMTTELRGRRVFVTSASPILYNVALAGLEQGVRGTFAPNSVVLSGGGAKGMALPDDWAEPVKEFFGVDRLLMGYGMSEGGALHLRCTEGRYHLQPWVVPYVLDPDTNAPLPRSGVQVGRAAFHNLNTTSYWGGTISGDEIELDWDTPCPCGQTSVHIADTIQRFSEKRGGDDKITCAATAEVHNDALNFMKEYEL